MGKRKMNDPVFSAYEYAIGGKMVVGTVIMDEMEAMKMDDTIGGKAELKENLLYQMVDYILKENLAEFTMVEDPANAMRKYRVRAYLAPNDQVKILRTAQKLAL
jgi:hypothetical protein